jgi:UDP-2,3-diacylglucosamine pyrophosphatase LpxH
MRCASALDAERIVVVMSDIEMGDGGVEDEFPHGAWLVSLLEHYQRGRYRDLPVDFVFNGDCFDLLKVPYDGSWPHHVTSQIALTKMASIVGAHADFFAGMREILAHPLAERRVHFVVGNHDAELLFPSVQALIRSTLGGRGVFFPGFSMRIGPVWLEHGNQQDVMFRMDPEQPFVEIEGQRVLNLAWASVALLHALIPLRPWFYFHDRLRPKSRVMDLVPEIRELLLARVWRYWGLDFWRDFLAVGDPLLKLDWEMVKEIVWRFTTTNTEVHLDPVWLSKTVEQESARLFVVGHLHQMGSYEHQGKRILKLGALRDEYELDETGTRFEPRLKQLLEIRLRDDQVQGVVSHELLGPPRDDGSIPRTVWDVLDEVEAAMDTMGDQREATRAREREERRG